MGSAHFAETAGSGLKRPLCVAPQFVAVWVCVAAPGPVLDEIARRHRATPAQVTLAWLLRRSPTMLPIPGTLSLDHVKENLAAVEIELSDAEFEALQ
jgi:aryl-alcohol dehydrogenase-like predicted oxidoreductase